MSNLRVDFAEQPGDAPVAGGFAEQPARYTPRGG